ncbi:MAG: hypoxanthine phosphoribosyltransferase [Limnochordia bacterium]|jgi:hypoxanthine phosphoribosyltransferase|nr:hypoxanthine phosphoribosyltransferase [Bacillota bacterium]HOB09063.1 hypoxanthine phosphoribosyltransferase [Limnochordia bacterium]NLH30762.1 hypoxanthine phosphoribosyltransferase [Bacillota bacterium]HPT92848.1 hypoxanthine phosphoribosyltransferase [Limnochordia bacterium]HPZ31192.1 hypoxanthine phosphoribosyltransferase [Limnochordia bacterium]
MDLDSVQEVLLTEAQIAERVRQLGQEISRDYEGKDLVVVGILKGAICFFSDLIRQVEIPVNIDFMAVSSYGSSSQTSGVVKILKDLDMPIEGRHILLVEDIVDTGLTLNYLKTNLLSRNPASLKVAALLDKPERRQIDIHADYLGFSIPDHFVVGYGIDYAEQYRSLPYVAILDPAAYQSQAKEE